MKTFNQLNRPTKWAGAALALVAVIALTMPTQAATLFEKAASTMREHVCERFCGCHHHHHCHEWCDGYRHFHCPGHH